MKSQWNPQVVPDMILPSHSVSMERSAGTSQKHIISHRELFRQMNTPQGQTHTFSQTLTVSWLSVHLGITTFPPETNDIWCLSVTSVHADFKSLSQPLYCVFSILVWEHTLKDLKYHNGFIFFFVCNLTRIHLCFVVCVIVWYHGFPFISSLFGCKCFGGCADGLQMTGMMDFIACF